nr:MAG TPA: hypothetical protein [Caudoviricetes sp.]
MKRSNKIIENNGIVVLSLFDGIAAYILGYLK